MKLTIWVSPEGDRYVEVWRVEVNGVVTERQLSPEHDASTRCWWTEGELRACGMVEAPEENLPPTT